MLMKMTPFEGCKYMGWACNEQFDAQKYNRVFIVTEII